MGDQGAAPQVVQYLQVQGTVGLVRQACTSTIPLLSRTRLYNTIVFSVLNALVLKPLPVADAERVYFVNNSGHAANSFPNYRDIRDRNAVFQSGA
jgi:hypothetical protein